LNCTRLNFPTRTSMLSSRWRKHVYTSFRVGKLAPRLRAVDLIIPDAVK
jgi:hypothetical protein